MVQWLVQRFWSERLRVRSRRSAISTLSAHVWRQSFPVWPPTFSKAPLPFTFYLNSTERGAFFRHFCVSNVITADHTYTSGVRFHILPRAFKQKKIKELPPKMKNKASRGGVLRYFSLSLYFSLYLYLSLSVSHSLPLCSHVLYRSTHEL